MLVLFAIPWTLSVYIAFFFWKGELIFDTDWGIEADDPTWWESILEFISDSISFAGDFGNFVTLGGLDPSIPLWIKGSLLILIGLPWFLVFLGLGRGTNVS